MSKILILMSGGIDSTLLATRAYEAGQLGAVLFIDYGQPAARMESKAVVRWAYRRKVELISMGTRIRGVGEKMRTGEGEPGLRILPGRNLILASHALNVAAARGYTEIQIGANADDEPYPDCRPGWIDTLDHLAMDDIGVHVRAPLIEMSKAEIIAEALAAGVDLDDTWSCYQPTGLVEPCGTCDSCLATDDVLGIPAPQVPEIIDADYKEG